MKKHYTFCAALFCAVAANAAVPVSGSVNIQDWRALPPQQTSVSASLKALPKLAPSRSAENPMTEFTADEANFYCYGDVLENGTDAVYLFLSNAGISKGDPLHEGQMARILLVAPPQEEGHEPVLPTGTFTCATTGEAGTFLAGNTDIMDIFPYPDDPSQGLVAYNYKPVDGTVTVSENEGGGYTVVMECTGALIDGDGNEVDRSACKVEYTGEVPYDDIFGYIPVDGDLELDIPNLSGRYSDGDYTLTFYSVELDSDGFIIGPGQLFNTELFVENVSPMNTDDLEGIYTPIDAFNEGTAPGRFMQGVWYDIFGGYYAAIGTALSVYDEYLNVSNVALAMDGTVTVTKVGDEHKFEFDLITAEGNKLTGSWQGVVADFVTDFSEPNAVDGIEAESAIRGGRGCVEAPSGARVFTLAGTEAGMTDLPAGVYVVKSGATVKKVVVR